MRVLERTTGRPSEGRYMTRLYAGTTPQSTRAIGNPKRLVEAFLKDRYQPTIVYLYQQPGRGRAEQIIAAPTVVKRAPPRLRRLIGILSDTSPVLLAIGNDPGKAS